MIVTALMYVLVYAASAVSVVLSAVPLPSWVSDGTIAGLFVTLKAYIADGPAPMYLDLVWIFSVFNAWWTLRIALIPAQWVLAVARRWLGPMIPGLRLDEGSGRFTFGSEASAARATTAEFQSRAQGHVDDVNTTQRFKDLAS